ncbi:type II membrane protein [Coemansia sp. Benny D115]|nr:type II membrane protein [Coemansia sp. Benny D115]
MHLSSALAALAATSLSFAAAAFDCKDARVAGFQYDLSALARETILDHNVTTTPTYTNTRYTINPCAALKPQPDSVPEIDRCPENAWICRSVTNYKKDEPRLTEVAAVAGTGKNDEPTLQATASGNERPKEFHWKMQGAHVDDTKWSTDIKFVCDSTKNNQDAPKLVAVNDGVLELEWAVPAACALGDKDGKGDKAPKDDDGDSGDGEATGGGFFSTLFTLLVSAFVLYFVLGVMYKYLVVRATGLDLIPNRTFWREFPYLCADFAQHVWDTVSGRRRSGYSVV